MGKYCPLIDSDTVYLNCTECEEHACNAFFCMVVGSRSFSDYQLMRRKLDSLLAHQTQVVIVSGGAKGADALAERYAQEKRYRLIIFHAEWNKYGKQAGFVRNKQMQKFLSKQKDKGIVAFWDGKSKGTAQNFQAAEELHIPLRIILC